MRGNGERIGPQNLPTSSIAGGIWNLLNQQRAQQRGAWPSATPAVVTDPYFMYVPLLLNTTSTNAQQNNTFLDSSSNAFTITRNGTPTQGAFTPYQPSGYWSGYFDGASYLSLASNAALAFGTGDFTIESWIYLTSLSASNTICDNRTADTASAYVFYVQSNGTLTFYDGAGGADRTSSAGAIKANTWYHVVATRSGTTFNLYINGAVAATNTGVSSNFGSSQPLRIGQQVAGTASWNGYMSNLRIVKGTAVYTSAFTPPTTPLTAITNTSLLTLQSNRFIDNSTNAFAITVNGTPKVQAFQPFAPAASYSAATYGGSGYFNGSTDYLTRAFTSTTDGMYLQGSTYTIEAWVYPQALSGFQYIYICNATNTSSFGYTSLYLSGTTLGFATRVSTSGTEYNVTGGTLINNQWAHIAFSVSSNVGKLFLNGVQVGSNLTISANTYTPTGAGIAFSQNGFTAGISYFSGYISNLRITQGTAIYTAAFTPPTTPLTAVSGTSLLTNFGNAGIYDAAWQNNALTVGDAQASTTQYKWSPTSMKFDGTGDWLTAIDTPGLQLGSGDFTIEGWFYLSATSAIYGIVSKGTATTGWSVNVTVLNKLQFSYTASNLTGSTSLSANTWYYFAVVRSGTATGNLKVYLNGTVDATSSGAVTDNFNQTSTFYTGADRIGGSALNGYLQDIRLTKGYARTITTPTAAFPTR